MNSYKLNSEEFISRLTENKREFKDAEELVEYQLPVLQFYLDNYQNSMIIDNTQLGGKVELINFSTVKLTQSYTPNGLQLMQVAFLGLVKRIKEFE